MHKELGGDTAGTVTPADPREVSRHMASGSAYRPGGDVARGLPGHWSVDSEQLFAFTSLALLEFYFSLFIIFLFIIIY